jgi:putative DNA primase/helicase
VLPNEKVREYLRRVIGMSLIGRQEQHKLPLLTGVGANGKSTAVDAILYALGDYAMAADPNLLTEGKTSSLGQVDLMGKRLAVVSETDKGAQMAEATAKQLTGGDRVKARKLYQDWVEFDPSHTLMMVTNHPPKVSGDDEATWRRLTVIRFNVVIPEDQRDGKLPERLKHDAEAILAWAVQGLADYQVDGLNPPEEVLGATADYRRKSDHLGRFIAECCTTSSPVLKVHTAALFEEWQRWAAAEGAEPVGRNTFNELVTKRAGITVARSNGKRWFVGIGLLQNGTSDGE